ncbi:helix-turn-helix domain-containing protein [Enterococcus alishanensis]
MPSNLLNKDVDRRLRLLTILSQNRWVQVDSLVSEIKASKQTIIKDITYLNDTYADTFKISTDKKMGVKFQELRNQNIQSIYISAYKNSRKTSLLIELLLQPVQDSVKWEEKLYISHSTLYRDLVDIKSFLSSRQININMDPIEIISQDERQLRFFFTHYLLNTTSEWPFELNESQISKLSITLSTQFKLNLSKFELTELNYLIALTLTRQMHGYYIDAVDIERVEAFHHRYIFSDKLDVLILDMINELNISRSDFNLTNFYYTVFWWYFGWESELEYSKLDSQANEFICSLQKRFDCEMHDGIDTNIKNYFLSIYLKHKIYPTDHLNFYDRRIMFSHSLEITFKSYHEEILELLLTMEKKYHFPWYTMYRNQMMAFIFIHWRHLFLYLDKEKTILKVVAASDLGEGHTQMICYFLEKHFGREIQVTTSSPDEIKRVLTADNFDVLVTNIRDIFDIDINLYIIDDVPTLRNLENLRDLFTQVTYEKATNRSFLVG